MAKDPEIPTDNMGRLIWLVRTVGVPVAIMSIVIWQAWQLADRLREEGREREVYAREVLTQMTTKSVEALTLATDAIEDNTHQAEEITDVLKRQTETNLMVREAILKAFTVGRLAPNE